MESLQETRPEGQDSGADSVFVVAAPASDREPPRCGQMSGSTSHVAKTRFSALLQKVETENETILGRERASPCSRQVARD